MSTIDFGPVVEVVGPAFKSEILVVCEHASNRIPAAFAGLGLDDAGQHSHIAWDPGALGVAKALADHVKAPLIYGQVSRLIYDCNRPPDAASAIPERSEVFDIPGNQNLTDFDRSLRVNTVYTPFFNAVTNHIDRLGDVLRLIVTVHSFTPVFNGQRRSVEIGLLHGKDDRFALAMKREAQKMERYDVRINQPYSAQDGVMHTLDLHGTNNGLLNVMLEVRNDLIAEPADQEKMGADLAVWIADTLATFAQAERAT